MRRRSFLFGAMCAAGGYALAGRAAPAGLGTLAYVQQDGLWIRMLPDGVPRRLLIGGRIARPRFSPSGQWIWCLLDEEPVVVRANGEESIRLDGSDAQWMPSGDSLLVEFKSGLGVCGSDSHWQHPEQIVKDAELPAAVAPGGREIVFADRVSSASGGESGRICRVALAQPDTRKVLSASEGSGKILCGATHDGSVLFWEDDSFSSSVACDGLTLLRIPADGGPARPMGVKTLIYEDWLSFSPARDRLAVCDGGGRDSWRWSIYRAMRRSGT